MLSELSVRESTGMLRKALDDFSRDCPGLIKMLNASLKGFPARSGIAGSGSSSGDVARPTEMLALQPDRAAEALQQAEQLMSWCVSAALELDKIRIEWRPYCEPPKPCANIYCPDRAIKAVGRRRCYKCDRFHHAFEYERGSDPPPNWKPPKVVDGTRFRDDELEQPSVVTLRGCAVLPHGS
jgi:hypothetical protein